MKSNTDEESESELNDSFKKDKDEDSYPFIDPINSFMGLIDVIKCLFK
jgi:hypothetical protein